MQTDTRGLPNTPRRLFRVTRNEETGTPFVSEKPDGKLVSVILRQVFPSSWKGNKTKGLEKGLVSVPSLQTIMTPYDFRLAKETGCCSGSGLKQLLTAANQSRGNGEFPNPKAEKSSVWYIPSKKANWLESLTVRPPTVYLVDSCV